ncbi:MAG: hypothetical protein ABIK10_02145 [candidate division WOR-3 bacterium]
MADRGAKIFVAIFVIIEIVLLVLLIATIITLFVGSDVSQKSSEGSDASQKSMDLNVRSAVLAVVAAIVGVLVPLHYSLVLDIIDEIKKNNQSANQENLLWLKKYIATSDIIIYVMAWFGASSLVEGVIGFAAHYNIISRKFLPIGSRIVGVVYFALSAVSIWRSLNVTKENRGLAGDCLATTMYLVTIIFVFIISIAWAISLFLYETRPGFVVLSLLILCYFYVGWHLLKIPAIPITRKMEIKWK